MEVAKRRQGAENNQRRLDFNRLAWMPKKAGPPKGGTPVGEEDELGLLG